ncbi:MAG: hypothetical protein IJ319_05535 [Bacteroidaceae bacterium]|nr:hypothetical protein [Bacteroidaceae bacterium]
MFAFLKSSHKLEYIKIAIKCSVTPDYVYNVAHGKECEGAKLDIVRKHLLNAGIIHEQRYG